MTDGDPLERHPKMYDEGTPEYEAWQEGYERGQDTIMVAYKFLPVPGGDLYGNLMYAVTDQVTPDLIEELGYHIGKEVATQMNEIADTKKKKGKKGKKEKEY